MAIIKLKLPSGEAKSNQTLAPILGQHQINLMEFCKSFNVLSLKTYTQNIPLSVKIEKLSKIHIIKSIKVSSCSIFFSLLEKNRITITRLYDFFLILSLAHLKNLNKKSTAKSLFGFLSSVTQKFSIVF